MSTSQIVLCVLGVNLLSLLLFGLDKGLAVGKKRAEKHDRRQHHCALMRFDFGMLSQDPVVFFTRFFPDAFCMMPANAVLKTPFEAFVKPLPVQWISGHKPSHFSAKTAIHGLEG